MNPIAFKVGNFDIRWYAIIILTGVLFGLVLAYYNCNKKNLSFDILSDGFLVSFPVAIIGARLYYVLFEFENYKENLLDIFNIRQGGLAIHGGLIAGLIAAFVYARVRKINFLDYLDVAAP